MNFEWKKMLAFAWRESRLKRRLKGSDVKERLGSREWMLAIEQDMFVTYNHHLHPGMFATLPFSTPISPTGRYSEDTWEIDYHHQGYKDQVLFWNLSLVNHLRRGTQFELHEFWNQKLYLVPGHGCTVADVLSTGLILDPKITMPQNMELESRLRGSKVLHLVHY